MSRLIFLDTEYNSAGELAQLAYVCLERGRVRAKNFYFRISEMDECAGRVNGLETDWLREHGAEYSTVRGEVLADFSVRIFRGLHRERASRSFRVSCTAVG